MADPMESIIADALRDAGVAFLTDDGGQTRDGLDFNLPEEGISIEVKRFHSPRISEQMSRTENVLVAQGEDAVKLLAQMIRAWGISREVEK